MNLRYFYYLSLLGLVFFISGCSTEESPQKGAATLPATSSSELKLNQEQAKLADIQTGKLEYRLISSTISCTGEIEVPPQGMASVSAPMGGFIQKSAVIPGTFIRKGQVLASLSSPDYISLQQEYLETQSELRFAEQEYERQQLLGEQNATATKKLQQSASHYQRLKGSLAGLQARLELIGISLKRLEEGNIQSTVALRAPISGYVTQINHHLGQFAEAREVLFEIVNQDQLHLELFVFEQDIARIEEGQTILFKPTGKDIAYKGAVKLVNTKRNAEDRTFTVHGHFDQGEGQLKPGMFVEAEILLNADSLPALPEKAFVYNENKPFVIIVEDGSYQTQAVETGRKMSGWVAINNPDQLKNKEVVTEGASRLFAAMQRSRE